MIDFAHRLYNKTFLIKNSILIKIKIPKVLRFLITLFSNVFIPISLRINRKKNYSLGKNTKSNKFTVSLTSFPNRISRVHLVLESILRQTSPPERLVLWLSINQFSCIQDVPKKILSLREKGVEIYLTEDDLRSYKKYYFLLKGNKNSSFIIIDDDIFYPSHLLENLIKTHNRYPNTVCANRCQVISANKPYKKWKVLKGKMSKPRYDLLPTGCGGVLYPEKALHLESINKNVFTELCMDADDIWLNCATFLNETPIVYTGANEYYLPIKILKNSHLHSKNVGESNNDKKIRLVKEYYKKNWNINIFDRLLDE